MVGDIVGSTITIVVVCLLWIGYTAVALEFVRLYKKSSHGSAVSVLTLIMAALSVTVLLAGSWLIVSGW